MALANPDPQTDFTEVDDVGGRITHIHTVPSYVEGALWDGENVYMYLDQGAGWLDLSQPFEWHAGEMGNAAGTAYADSLTLSAGDAIGDVEVQNIMGMKHDNNGSYQGLAYHTQVDGYIKSAVAIKASTRFYPVLRYDPLAGVSGTMYLDVYSDASHTTLTHSQSLAISATMRAASPLRYLYCFCGSYNAGSGSGYTTQRYFTTINLDPGARARGRYSFRRVRMPMLGSRRQ